MKFPGFTILKVSGVIVILLGIAALAVVAAPFVYGQSQHRAPLATQVRTQFLGGSHIGVEVRDADNADVERAKLPAAAGAVVEEVRADSPAADAGLRAGDVITRFDGERVRSARHFERLVSDTPVGRQVAMTVVRVGQNIEAQVTPEAAPSVLALDSLRGLRDLDLRNLPELRDFEFHEPFAVTVPNFDTVAPSVLLGRGRLGVGVQDMTDQLAGYFGASEGVLVTSVEDDTPAATAGLKAGDVITKIDGEAVRSTTELRRRLDRAEGEIEIALVRDRREQTIKADIGDLREIIRRRIVR